MDEETRLRRRASFDQDAAAYHQARPGYPERVYDLLAECCGLGPGSRVLEIGPGTGQATGELLARGARVDAVELGPHLADRLRQNFPGAPLTVIEGDFQTVPLEPAAYDLVVSATAFHWLDTAAAVRKAATALTGGGWLAVWWSVFGDPERPAPLREALEPLYRTYLPNELHDLTATPRPLQLDARAAELTAGGWFGPVETEVIRWQTRLTSAATRRMFATFSNVAELPGTQRVAFLDGLETIVADQFGGEVTEDYLTVLYLARRRD